MGEANMQVEYQGQTASLSIVVVSGDKPCLMGRNWLKEVKLDWKTIFSLNKPKPEVPIPKPPALQELLVVYADLFKEELGTLSQFQAHTDVKEGAQPKFFKQCPVPYALWEGVEQEFQRLEQKGIIYPVSQSLGSTHSGCTQEG